MADLGSIKTLINGIGFTIGKSNTGPYTYTGQNYPGASPTGGIGNYGGQLTNSQLSTNIGFTNQQIVSLVSQIMGVTKGIQTVKSNPSSLGPGTTPTQAKNYVNVSTQQLGYLTNRNSFYNKIGRAHV